MKVPSNPAVSAAIFAACALATTFLAPNTAAQVRPQREQITWWWCAGSQPT